MSLKSVIAQISGQGEEYISNLINIQTLPQFFDSIMVGYNHDSLNKAKSLIDEIAKEIKNAVKKGSFDKNKLNIEISLLTYLLLYRIPAKNSNSNIDHKILSKLLASLLISCKNNDFSQESLKIIIGCLSALCSYDIGSLQYVYDEIFDYINTSEIKVQEMFIDLFSSITQIPFLLSIIQTKKHTNNTNIIKFINTLIHNFINRDCLSDQHALSISTDDIELVENFCLSLNNQKEPVSQEVKALLLFLFIRRRSDILSIHDYFLIIKTIPQFFIKTVTDNQAENLASSLSTAIRNNDIEESQHHDFVQLLLVVLDNRPSSFIEIFNSLRSIDNFEWCISELIKEIFTQKSIILSNPSLNTSPDVSNDDFSDNNESEHPEKDDDELEDLDKFEKKPKNEDVKSQAFEIIVKTSLQFIFNGKSIESQLTIFEGMGSSSEIFDLIVLNSNGMLKNLKETDEDDRDANPNECEVIDYLAEHLLSIFKETLQSNFIIHSMIPEVVALLIKKRLINQSDSDGFGDKEHIYSYLKLLALITLTEREENKDVLKALGYETGNLEEAFLSFSASSDSYTWKSELQDIMYKCFATLVSILKEPDETIDKEQVYKRLKYSFIGCIVLSPISKLESFITLLSLIFDPKAIDVISDAFRYINISDISGTASQMFCKLFEPRKLEDTDKLGGFISLIISLLKNRNWNKEKIINANLSANVHLINQLISERNEFSHLYIQILIQILIADKDEGIDIFIKEKAVRVILENLNHSESVHSDIIKAISITYKSTNIESVKSKDRINEFVLVPHIFCFIEKYISETNTENDELIEAISSVCSFYRSAFEMAFQKLNSGNQKIIDIYSRGLIRFLENSQILSLEDSFSILDFFMVNHSIIANDISNIGFNDVICEHIYSPKIAEDFISKLIQIHFDVFEKNKSNENLENITVLRSSNYTDQIISHYCRESSNQWAENYYEINSSICQRIIDSAKKEDVTEFARAFIDQFNEFVDTFPPEPLKIVYYLSSLAEPDYIKRILFQEIITYHVISYKLGHSQALPVSTLSHLILNAKGPRRCESFMVQKILHNKKLPPQYKLTDDDYINFLGTIVRNSCLLYEKGKKLYEKEGLSNMFFNKSQPKLDTTALFNKLCSTTMKFTPKDPVSEEEKTAIDQFILKLFQFSIEYNHSFPEEWNNDERLKEIYQSSIFFKQLEADMPNKANLHTAEEKKWYIVSYIMIAMSTHNIKNNDIYVRLLSLVIKRFEIECKYQIPILDESFSGRLDSLAFQVSEGIAECNGDSACIFLHQYFNALKKFNGEYEISSLIAIQPWSIVAGKRKNNKYIEDLIDLFLEKIPITTKETTWARPASILVHNLSCYSNACNMLVNEILAEILVHACLHCTPEDERKVNLISKILVMNLKASDKETNEIYPSLIHSCIIGTAVYDSSNLRSLLHFALSKFMGIDNEINFLEDVSIRGYDCLLRIAYLLSEKWELLKDFRGYFEEAFFDDAIKAPWDQISITGWLFLAAFTQFDKLPTKEYKVDADYYKSYKSKEKQTEESRKDEYNREEVEDIVNNHTKPYSPIHKLLRLSISNPNEFCDIISLYVRRFNNIKEIQASGKIIEFNGNFGSYFSTIPICFAFINVVRFTSFEAKTLKELFGGDSTDDNWEAKAQSFFVYLVLSKSNNLNKFIFSLDNDDKFIKLLMNLSTGFNISIEDVNVEPSSLHDLVSKLSEKGSLESVANNLIQNVSNGRSALNSISVELLSHLFSESTIWMQSKKTFPNVLWNIYSIVEKKEKAEVFVKPIQALLDWNISEDVTIDFCEALIILEQIASKLDIGTVEKLAKEVNLFNDSEQRIDFDKILENMRQKPAGEIMGAIFIFGKDKVSSLNQRAFEELFSNWIDESKECSPVISALINEQYSFQGLNLAKNSVPGNFKFDVISYMILAETLSDIEAEIIVESANVWVTEQSLAQLSKMLVHLMKSKYIDQSKCASLFSNILCSINKFIAEQDTIENIVNTIKGDASKVKQIIAKTNEEINNLTNAVIEGNNIFNDAKDLVKILYNCNDKNQEEIKEIAGEIDVCIDQYNHHIKIAPIIEDVSNSLEAMAMNVKIEIPQSLHEEHFTRNILSHVMRLLIITETELPGFNCMVTVRILQQLARANPNVVLPFVYAYHGMIPEKMKELISVVESTFINNLKPCNPVLVNVLEENNFEKLFNDTLSIEELIDIITYLALTRRFDEFFAVANERLTENPNLSEDSLMTKIFTAVFCFLVRPLEFDTDVLESLSERNVNDVLYQICLSENFYYYFNKLTVGNDIKKSLFIECIFKQFLKSPDLFITEPKLARYTYSTLVFGNLADIDDFIESISHKNALCSTFNYNNGAESRESVIRILQKQGFIESDYKIENEKEQQIIDFRICSEFGVFARIVDNPITCLAVYQRQSRFSDPVVVCINMPSIRYLLNYDRCTLWMFANSIQSESEAMKLIFMLSSVYISPKKVREFVSFIIMKYPQAAAKALENVMDSAFNANIAGFQVMCKKEEYRSTHTMRYIRLLCQLAQLFPGLFSDCGPKLVANCISSLTISSFRWIKYVRGLISHYVDHIDSTNETINEKKEALMKAIDEKERHFDVIAEAAFDLFGAIGEEKQSEFVSIFNSISIFDFLYLYPMGISAHIKFCELGVISDDKLKMPNEIDKMIRSIVRFFMSYFLNEDGSWTCNLTGVFETIEKLVSLRCSARQTKLLAWLSVVCIMSREKNIRLASLSLLHTCISRLAEDNEIVSDEFLASCMSTANLIKLNENLHKLLTNESNRSFISIFAVCVSVAFGYDDEETKEAVNGLLKDAWVAWSQRAIASLYILLPMAAYSSLDIKEVTGMDFVPLLDAIVPSLHDVDFMFIHAYDRSAARDWKCSRERLAILCPNLSYSLKKKKNYDPRKETVRVLIPELEKRIYYFSLTYRAIINASRI